MIRGLLAPGLAGYLLGALPFALLIGRRHGVDPREAGERNPGAWNVWGLAGWRAGAAVLLLDCAKGFAATLAGLELGGRTGAQVGAVAAMAGHGWPWWSRFRHGGRSVAVLVGAGPLLAPLPAAIAALGGAVALAARVPRRRAVGSALMAFPVVAAALERDRRRLIWIGAAYGVLLVRWKSTTNAPGGREISGVG